MPTTILEWIQYLGAGIAGTNLVKFLDRSASAHPDLKNQAEAIKNELSAELSPDNVVATAEKVKAALDALAQGKTSPADPPSDSI